MQDLTANAIRQILSLDSDITPELVEKFIVALDPKRAINTPLVRVIRYPEVMERLAISRSTLLRLLRDGHLTRVFTCSDKYGLGVSAESFNRFINTYTQSPKIHKDEISISPKKRREASREQYIRKLRWRLHLTASSTRTERYEAVARLIASDKRISKCSACLAAGIPVSSFRTYLNSLNSNLSERSLRLIRVADIIGTYIPKDGPVPSLRAIKKMLLARGVKTTQYSIANILDKLGYNRVKAY